MLSNIVGWSLLGLIYLILFGALLRLRRMKKRGLEGSDHRLMRLGPWELLWPDWWPDPREGRRGGWQVDTQDHDGRVHFYPLEGEAASVDPDTGLRRALEEHGFRLDEWELEDLPAAHGMGHAVEGRADADVGARAYVWFARLPGPEPDQALLIFYRASVLYGLADGFWLNQVAQRARFAPQP